MVQSSADVSPWMRSHPDEPTDENAKILGSRADLDVLLWPLRNKFLLCDGSCNGGMCWGDVLVSYFCKSFGNEPEYAGEDFYLSDDDVSDDDESDGCVDDAPDVRDVDVLGNLSERQGDVIASGKQVSRKRPAQLIPPGLSPDEHLDHALELRHPFLEVQRSTSAVTCAITNDVIPLNNVNEFRSEVVECLTQLAKVTADEDAWFLRNSGPSVGAVLNAYKPKKVAFMREVAYLTEPEDYAAVCMLVVGLPMLGWAAPAMGLMPRVKPPTCSTDEWLEDRENRNQRIIGRVTSSGDEVLDTEAFNKSMAEVKVKVLLGPFHSIDCLPIDNVSVAARTGIWECHGDSIDPSVRNIDNLRTGKQNHTAGTTSSHRPTDADALVAQVRAITAAYPGVKILGWTSDFSKAYKQVPGDPSQVRFVVLVQFCPTAKRAVFLNPLSNVFGSKSAPFFFPVSLDVVHNGCCTIPVCRNPLRG